MVVEGLMPLVEVVELPQLPMNLLLHLLMN
jgi:hypothetical protein